MNKRSAQILKGDIDVASIAPATLKAFLQARRPELAAAIAKTRQQSIDALDPADPQFSHKVMKAALARPLTAKARQQSIDTLDPADPLFSHKVMKAALARPNSHGRLWRVL
jgi:hypothetical protein